MAALPDVVPRRRTYNVGGERIPRDTIEVTIDTQSQADVQSMLRLVALEETQGQIALGNDPTRVFVDNKEGRPILDAERRVEVFFGDTINQLALKALERELAKTMLRRLTPTLMKITAWRMRDGTEPGMISAIRNIRSSWEWVLVPRNGPEQVVNPYSGQFAFNYGDRLVLRPKMATATMANSTVTRKGHNYKPTRGKNRGQGVTRNWGFMRETVNTLKRKALFKPYTIYVTHSRAFRTPGDPWTYGTARINIVARRKTQLGRNYRSFS